MDTISMKDAEVLRVGAYGRGFVKAVLVVAVPVFVVAIVVITTLVHFL